MVTWAEPRQLDKDDIITDYEVQLEPLEFPTDISINNIITMNVSVVATDLEEFINYSVCDHLSRSTNYRALSITVLK